MARVHLSVTRCHLRETHLQRFAAMLKAVVFSLPALVSALGNDLIMVSKEVSGWRT